MRPARLISRPVLAILLPGILLAATAFLAFENSSQDTEARDVEITPGVALSPSTSSAAAPETATPEPVVTYSLAVPAGFEDFQEPLEAFAGTASLTLAAADTSAELSLGWAMPGREPDTAFTDEDVVLTVPIAAPVFTLTYDQLRAVVGGRVSNWSEVGGGDAPVNLALAAGQAAAVHGLPSGVQGVPNEASTNLQLYSGMSTQRRALRIDGKSPLSPDYPLKVSRVVSARPAVPDEVTDGLVAALRTAAAAEPPSVTLAAVGDLMLANVIASNLANQGVDQPFALVAPYLQQADITFGNLEGQLTERGTARPKNYTFRTPPSLAGGLVNAGFDVLSVGNNHTMDFGPDGLVDTLVTLDQLDIPRVGAGANEAEARRPVILEANGLKIGFLAYVNVGQEVRSNYVNETAAAGGDSPGVAWAYPEDVAADVTALRPQVDVVVVSMHIGLEGSFELREWQFETAHAAIDSGAALVLGHHAHVLQRIEPYGDGVIIFGLGNFVFDVANPGRNNSKTVIAYFELTRDGVTGYDFVPAEINVFENRPQPLLDARGVPILTHLLGLNELPPDFVPTPTATPTATP